jgi:hypothetical protein
MIHGYSGRSRAARGTVTMFGFAALTVVLGLLCSAVLLRSLDSYAASARVEMRLQALAAAEGAVVALLAAPGAEPATGAEPLAIGPCRVRFGAAQPGHSSRAVPLTVEIYRTGDRPALTQHYLARLRPHTDGGWRLDRLEVIR